MIHLIIRLVLGLFSAADVQRVATLLDMRNNYFLAILLSTLMIVYCPTVFPSN